ncbi:MAG: hypothetical protein J6S91_02530 [Treponema sp.]|jgi:predicted Abi (CAAX) family protease|nr:hypothetical protein [Treponema sp.]
MITFKAKGKETRNGTEKAELRVRFNDKTGMTESMFLYDNSTGQTEFSWHSILYRSRQEYKSVLFTIQAAKDYLGRTKNVTKSLAEDLHKQYMDAKQLPLLL